MCVRESPVRLTHRHQDLGLRYCGDGDGSEVDTESWGVGGVRGFTKVGVRVEKVVDT